MRLQNNMDLKNFIFNKQQASVGLFNECFPPVMDGVSVCVENYAKWLQKLAGDVKVITPSVPGADYSKLDYQVLDYMSIPVPKRHPYVTGVAEIDPRYLAQISKIHFKIVHAHSPFASGMAAQRIAKLQGIPLVATFHSKYRDDFSRVLPKPVVDAIVKVIIDFYEKADMVWVPQESVIDVIREYGFKGHVEVMDNGSDLVADYPEKYFVDARRELGIKPEEFVMLFVGQHIWEKNPRLIIESLSRMPDVPFRMFFIGTGYAEQDMKALVTEKGLVKIVSGGEFETRMKTMNATKLADDDRLVFAGVITDQKYAVLISRNGFVLKFPLEQVSEMKKTAAGMQGMKLGREDLVEKALMIREKEPEPFEYRETQIDLGKMRVSARNGKGTKRF